MEGVQDALLTLAGLILTVMLNWLIQTIRQKYLKDIQLKELELLEKEAYTAVKGAEQKVDKVADLVLDLMGDKPTGVNEQIDWAIEYSNKYKEFKKLTNEQKKTLVMDFLKAKFPKLPIEQIDLYAEKAYMEYKIERYK